MSGNKIKRDLPNDEYQAAVGANSPSVSNVFATIADIAVGGVVTVTGTAPVASSGGTSPDISMTQADTVTDGYLSSADWTTFNGKVPSTRNITINGTTQDLSADRTWSVGTVTSAGITAGTGISLAGTNPITSSGNITVTNAAPDQTVVLNNGTGINVTGTYPNFTIDNTDLGSAVTLTSAGGTETLVNDGTGPALATKGVTAGTGISLSSTATDLTVTNTAPDQVVALTAGTGINVTGTYPNFTIDNTGALSDVNIYNADGTLSGFRILDLNAQGLSFSDTTANGQFSVNMDDGTIRGVDFVVNALASSLSVYDNVTGGGGALFIDKNEARLEVLNPVGPVTRKIEATSAGIEVNGLYRLPNTDGTAGQVLTSTSLGLTAFQSLPAEIQAAASDEVTNLTTGTAKVTFRMPYAMTLTEVRASLSTAQTAGALLTVDINLNGVSVLGTKLTFDNTEKTTVTAAIPATIVTSALTDDGEITVDIDAVGSAGARGLKITLIGTRA